MGRNDEKDTVAQRETMRNVVRHRPPTFKPGAARREHSSERVRDASHGMKALTCRDAQGRLIGNGLLE